MKQSPPKCWYLSIKLMPTPGNFKLVGRGSRLKWGKQKLAVGGQYLSESIVSQRKTPVPNTMATRTVGKLFL